MVPAAFELSAGDQTTLEPPVPFFASIPRAAYLHCSAADAVAYFSRFSAAAAAAAAAADSATAAAGAGSGARRVWFEDTVRGEALRWHIPTGVLYDAISSPGEDLPWRITVHFRGYPDDVLLPCAGDEDVKWKYLNSLKQAAFLRHGSAMPIMSLTKAKQTQLWDAVRAGDGRKRDLVLGALAGAEEVRHVPIRVVLRSDPQTVQAPIPALCADGTPHTLRSALALLLPELLLADEDDDSPCEASADGGALAVFVQGLRPPLDAPLELLHDELRHPDLFMYVTVR